MEETDKETAEVMKCLLSMSKVPSNQFGEVHYWQNCDTVNCDGEQIIWKLDSDSNVVQQVPVEYKIEKPLLYVTQGVIKNEQADLASNNKVVLIQETAPYHELQFIPSTAFDQTATVEVDAGSKTDSSHSESIDVEVDDLDTFDEPQHRTSDLCASSDKEKKCKKKKKKGGNTSFQRRKQTKDAKQSVKPSDSENEPLKPGESPSKAGRVRDDEFKKLEDNWQQVEERFKLGCECSSNCFDGLNPEKVFRHHLNVADLTKAEHDMYLMGNILASMQNPEETCRKKERVRMRTTYAFYGKKVCLTAFLYLEHVTLYQMKRIRKHLQNHGVSPRIHGNHGRKPSNTLPLDIYQQATAFVQNFIKRHHVKTVPNVYSTVDAVKPKASRTPQYRLPADCTKKTLHDEYKLFCEKWMPTSKVMQYSTFTNFFKKQFPNVKFRKPDKYERKNDEYQESSGEKSRKVKVVKVRSKNKVIQTVSDSNTDPQDTVHPVTVVQSQSQRYRSPYILVQASQVVLNGDSPVILQTQTSTNDQF